MDDETQLINQRHIGTMPRGAHMAIFSETPADYDPADVDSFSNPLYHSQEVMKSREDSRNADRDSFISYDDDDYTEMAPIPDP